MKYDFGNIGEMKVKRKTVVLGEKYVPTPTDSATFPLVGLLKCAE
jgi:hypothetical protein